MKRLLVVPLALLSFVTVAGAQGAPLSGKKPVEMKATGTPGTATATRTMRVTATVYAIDAARRIVTLQNDLGGIETMKVGPEVKRLEDFAVGDTVVIDYDQGLALELQPAGAEFVPPTAVDVGARAGKDQVPGAAAAMGVRGTVTVTAIDMKKRLVTLQGPGGNVYRVKAEPRIQLDKLKVGDKLLATYVEAVAIRLEKKR